MRLEPGTSRIRSSSRPRRSVWRVLRLRTEKPSTYGGQLRIYWISDTLMLYSRNFEVESVYACFVLGSRKRLYYLRDHTASQRSSTSTSSPPWEPQIVTFTNILYLQLYAILKSDPQWGSTAWPSANEPTILTHEIRCILLLDYKLPKLLL
jgi:hypothetical protein